MQIEDIRKSVHGTEVEAHTIGHLADAALLKKVSTTAASTAQNNRNKRNGSVHQLRIPNQRRLDAEERTKSAAKDEQITRNS